MTDFEKQRKHRFETRPETRPETRTGRQSDLPAGMHPDLRRFYWRWERNLTALLPGGGARLLAGVSGGRDSMVLAWLLNQSRQRGICDLALAHVNHQLRREQAAEDEAFVLRLGARWGLPVGIKSVVVQAQMVTTGQSPEQAARVLRYNGLRELARELDCSVIALGHHMDDQAETVLLRLLRGAGPRGIGAMAPAVPASRDGNPTLIRPLLTFRRRELAKIAVLAEIDWREDESNRDLNIKRNRIRHDLLPRLCDTYNPRLVEALADLADRQRSGDELIGQLATDLYHRARTMPPQPTSQPPRPEPELHQPTGHQPACDAGGCDHTIVLDRKELITQHPVLVSRVLYMAYQDLAGMETTLSSAHMDALLHLVGHGPPSPGSTPKEAHLPRRVRASRQRDVLVLEFHAPYSQESP